MPNRLLRPLLIVEFLIAVQAIFTIWSEVGGQYHLDLMFWPWKLGIGVASAGLIVAITANLVRNEGQIKRRAIVYFSFLIAVLVVAGVVTYYYHLYEPTDQDDDQGDDPAKISLVLPGEVLEYRSLTVTVPLNQYVTEPGVDFTTLPGAAGISSADHG